MLFVFIFGVLGSGFYFMFELMTSSNDKRTHQQSNNAIEVEKDIIVSSNIIEENIKTTLQKQSDIETDRDKILSDSKTEENTGNLDESSSGQTAELNNEINSTENTSQETAYRADITQQDNDITITIHQPLKEIESNDNMMQQQEVLAREEILNKNNIAIKKTIDSISPEKLDKSKLKSIVKPKQLVKEITHIVVKGDTLWAIAKKYVHNPFLYPELARLSNIKNPHRIYPGNRVRIRFIKK